MRGEVITILLLEGHVRVSSAKEVKAIKLICAPRPDDYDITNTYLSHSACAFIRVAYKILF